MSRRVPRAALAAGLAVAACALPTSAAGQAVPASDSTGGVPVLSSLWRTLSDPARGGWVRPLASSLIPGTGQLLARESRGALYLVSEAFLLVRFLALNKEGRRERDRFLDLAFVVARGGFAPADRDTVFEYYEQMGRFVESGAFDTDPGPAFVPPSDERTYNGSIWALARRTYFTDPDAPPPSSDPAYQRAVAFYASRAIGPNYQWSWRNAGLEQDLFRQTIRQSDEAFRAATQQLGLLLANHVLSAVDAFISHRLSRPDRRIRIDSSLAPLPGRGGVAIRTRFRVAF